MPRLESNKARLWDNSVVKCNVVVKKLFLFNVRLQLLTMYKERFYRLKERLLRMSTGDLRCVNVLVCLLRGLL